MGFYLIKKYCSYQKLWAFKDLRPRTLLWLLASPYRCKDRHKSLSSGIHTYIQSHRYWRFCRKTGDHFLATFYNIERWSIRHLKDNRLGRGLGYIKTSSASIFTTWWRHQVGHFLRFPSKSGDHFLATIFKIESWSNRHLKDNHLDCGLGYNKTSSASIFITLWRHQIDEF